MYKICFYVPASDLERVKNALFDAGAGQVGQYDRCAWQTLGQGQFRPLEGADPHLGTVGEVETVSEYKVELVCDDNKIEGALSALRRAHPYEEPAFDVWALNTDLE